jgi:hypothetical protein
MSKGIALVVAVLLATGTVPLGAETGMEKLVKLHVLVTTAAHEAAGTKWGMGLNILDHNGKIIIFGSLGSEQGFPKGSSAHCEVDMWSLVTWDYVSIEEIAEIWLLIDGAGDEWLPKHIFVIGEDLDGKLHFLNGVVDWPEEMWFSYYPFGAIRGRPMYRIDRKPSPAVLGVFTEVTEKGVLVESVISGTPAENAGLQKGDIVVEVDGEALRGWAPLERAIGSRYPGDTIQLLVQRDDTRLVIEVKLVGFQSLP